MKDVVEAMTKGPKCKAVILSKDKRAVEDWITLIGPAFIEKARETAPNR